MNASKKTSSARCIIKKLFIIRKRIHGWTRVRYGYILCIMLYTIAAAGVRFSVLRQTCANIYLGIYMLTEEHIYIHIHSPKQQTVNNTVSGVSTQRIRRHFSDNFFFFFLQNSGTPTPFTAINLYIYTYNACLLVCVFNVYVQMQWRILWNFPRGGDKIKIFKSTRLRFELFIIFFIISTNSDTYLYILLYEYVIRSIYYFHK